MKSNLFVVLFITVILVVGCGERSDESPLLNVDYPSQAQTLVDSHLRVGLLINEDSRCEEPGGIEVWRSDRDDDGPVTTVELADGGTQFPDTIAIPMEELDLGPLAGAPAPIEVQVRMVCASGAYSDATPISINAVPAEETVVDVSELLPFHDARHYWPLAGGEFLLCEDEDNRLVRTDGHTIVATAGDDELSGFCTSPQPFVRATGEVILTGDQGSGFVLDSDLELLWTLEDLSTIAVVGENIFEFRGGGLSDSGYIAALDPSDGSTLWESELDSAHQVVANPIVQSDGTVVVLTAGLGLNAEYELWTISPGDHENPERASIVTLPPFPVSGAEASASALGQLYADGTRAVVVEYAGASVGDNPIRIRGLDLAEQEESYLLELDDGAFDIVPGAVFIEYDGAVTFYDADGPISEPYDLPEEFEVFRTLTAHETGGVAFEVMGSSFLMMNAQFEPVLLAPATELKAGSGNELLFSDDGELYFQNATGQIVRLYDADFYARE